MEKYKKNPQKYPMLDPQQQLTLGIKIITLQISIIGKELFTIM
jgi:hypothetical protein